MLASESCRSELVAPNGWAGRNRTQRKAISTAVGSILVALTIIAVVAIKNGSQRGELLWDGSSTPTGQAAAVRGSAPTADAEAAAIMETNGMHFDEDMGVPYIRNHIEDGGHFNQEQVADAIVDNANLDNEDVTGKEKADLYASAVKNLQDPQLLRGSLPTYRAEAKYILGGVTDNYEKSLENSRAAGLASNGKATARDVAALIINSAYRGVRDCTGSTDADGNHGPGLGMPPCPVSTSFAQGRCPANMQIRQGEFQSNLGAECQCVPGYFGPATTGPCTPCPENTYCPGGAVLLVDDASPSLPCPADSSSAAAQSQCICGKGYFGSPHGNPASCARCPHGQYCPGDGLAFNCPNSQRPTDDQTACRSIL